MSNPGMDGRGLDLAGMAYSTATVASGVNLRVEDGLLSNRIVQDL